MIATLEKMFGSAARVKIMRLFLFNPTITFDIKRVSMRSKVSSSAARKEISMMEKIGLVKRRSFYKEHPVCGKGGKRKTVRLRTTGWIINEEFEYLEPLQSLLIY